MLGPVWLVPDQRGYPSSEDIPVTFQIGIVGTDGVLLASDVRARSTAGFRDGISAGVDFSATTEKLFCYPEFHHAYCIAGNDNTIWRVGHCAHENIKKHGNTFLDHETVRSLLWDSVNEICKSIGPIGSKYYGSMLLSYQGQQSVDLWRVNLNGFGPGVNAVLDKTFEGDAANSAAFFLVQYYRAAPIKQLLPLAAHCVLTAAKLNPTGVEGLEIVVSTLEQTRKLEKQELSALKQASETLEAAIYQHISQFFT